MFLESSLPIKMLVQWQRDPEDIKRFFVWVVTDLRDEADPRSQKR